MVQAPVTQKVTTRVISLGKQQKSDGWDLQTEPTMGSKFPSHFYGKVWADVEDIKVNDVVALTLQRGNLKQGKTGQYPTDFFYDVVSVEKGATGKPEAKSEAEDDLFGGEPYKQKQPATPYEEAEVIKRRSIERQKAVEIAFQYAAPRKDGTPLTTEDRLLLADVLYKFISAPPSSGG